MEEILIQLTYFYNWNRYLLLKRRVRSMNLIADLHRSRRSKENALEKFKQLVAKRKEILRVCKLLSTQSLTLSSFENIQTSLSRDFMRGIYVIQYDRLKVMKKYFKFFKKTQ